MTGDEDDVKKPEETSDDEFREDDADPIADVLAGDLEDGIVDLHTDDDDWDDEETVDEELPHGFHETNEFGEEEEKTDW